MALSFKKGDTVRQVIPTITGVVVDVAVIDADVQFLVEYTGVDGMSHQRYFKETEISAGA